MLTLIVDDDATWCRSISRIIDGQKLIATDLATARELVRAYRPNVILLDVVLPDGIGWESIKELRALSPATEVVVATSCGSRVDRLRATVEMGAYDYLDKSQGTERIRTAVVGAYLASLVGTIRLRLPAPVQPTTKRRYSA